MYQDVGPIDGPTREDWLRRAIAADLAPGPGGSRIVPLGRSGVRVVALYPSSQLVAHRDPPIVGTRYHIPLVLNPGCWVLHGGTWQQLELGRVYAMDPTQEHGAVNWGAERRLHLIWDCEGSWPPTASP